MEAVRRACFECMSTVFADDLSKLAACPRGHDAAAGWYVVAGDHVIGLGHEHLPGYLTSEGGVDLFGYRLVGALRSPQLVVDMQGRQLAVNGVVMRFPPRGLRAVCLDPATERRVLLLPSTPVRPLPRTKESPALLRAMFRAVHERVA